MSQEYQQKEVDAEDGVTIAYREYGDANKTKAIICLPGMSRNARDFHGFAIQHCDEFRILALDLRGRGRSGWADDPASYVSKTYQRDILRVLKHAGLERIAIIGSSFGGALGVRYAAEHAQCICGLVLNDFGPGARMANSKGIMRFLRERESLPDWEAAAVQCARRFGEGFPLWTRDDWLAQARRQFRKTPQGTIEPDFDPDIAFPFEHGFNDDNKDLWELFRALGNLPVLVIRGELSGNVSDEDCDRMMLINNSTTIVDIAEVGHTPLLTETDLVAPLRAFLRRLW